MGTKDEELGGDGEADEGEVRMDGGGLREDAFVLVSQRHAFDILVVAAVGRKGVGVSVRCVLCGVCVVCKQRTEAANY